MALGNKGFLSGLAEATAPAATSRLPPRTNILAGRENRLAELATGAAQNRVHELVDPARCRIWAHHNRDYAALTAENCADLIDSIKAQGRQEVPAVVRRVSGDPDHAFEVVCGARRHWTVTWLRAHDYPELKFLVEPRELTDEEAFRIADLENRSRQDLSDYERAVDYARALDRYYGGSQQRMAERLKVSKSWLSRYLELAKLPETVVAAFGTKHAMGIRHAADLAPLLKAPKTARAVLSEADTLAGEQQRRRRDGQAALPPSVCAQRLTRAGRDATLTKRSPELITINGRDGTPLIKAKATSRKGCLSLDIPSAGKADRAELIAAFEKVLDRLMAPSSHNR